MRLFLLAATAAALTLPLAAQAQSGLEPRVGKLESEMRAVQRKVFPGGAGSLVLPDVVRPDTAPEISGAPATSAVADLTQRVDSLERQVATLTGQVEQNSYRMRQLSEQFDAYKRRTDERFTTMATPPPATTGGDPVTVTDVEPAPARPSRGTAPRTPAATPSATTPAAKPAAAGAIEKPSTGNAAEDEYMFGYRLWAAKRYPEAEAQLKKVVSTYPKDRRASFAQNLLGRSYLDDGKPSLASMAFYDNYKKMPDGERAPDSLYYLGQALMKLNKPADACKVYGELTDVYGGKISAAMKTDVERGRAAAKCQ